MLLAMMVAALSLTACGGDDEDDINGNNSYIVGTWSVTSGQGWGDYTGDEEPEYVQFKSNGTYINVQFDDGLYITKGTWTATDTELIMKETEGNIKGTYTYSILNHTQSTLTLKMWGITANLTKVPDSTIDKYINGNYEEEDGVSSAFTIVFKDSKEETYTYDSDLDIKSLCAEFGNLEVTDPRGSYFGMMIGLHGYFYIIFPRQLYGEYLAPSFFSVGYSDFGADATEMECVTGGSGWYGDYISGSAKVTKNDGKYITINFNNYKYSVTSGYNTNRTAYVTLKGSLSFKISYK